MKPNLKIIINESGLFTFETVYPLLEGWKSSTGSDRTFEPSNALLKYNEYYWKVISHIPPHTLNTLLHKSFIQFLTLYIFLVILLLFASYIIARIMLRRKEAEKELKDSEELYRSLLSK